jgi:hypothetical protein
MLTSLAGDRRERTVVREREVPVTRERDREVL